MTFPFELLHLRLLTCFLDDPYNIEQLRDPRMNLSVVRPLVDKLYELDDVSVGMYCIHFTICFVIGHFKMCLSLDISVPRESFMIYFTSCTLGSYI